MLVPWAWLRPPLLCRISRRVRRGRRGWSSRTRATAGRRLPGSLPVAGSSEGAGRVMGEVLVLAEHAGGEVKKMTLELVTAARRLGSPSVVWAGPGADAAVGRLAEYGAD